MGIRRLFPSNVDNKENSRWFGLLFGLVFLLAVTARILPGPRTIDDAYITFRYARNILAGVGFVYNPGRHILGTTTPLYTLCLVVLGFFTGGTTAPFPVLALGFNALLDGLTAALLVLVGRRLNLPWAGAGAGLAWALAPWTVTFAIGGMETSLYVFLLVGMWAAYLYRRYTFTGLAAALAFLTRPDALALVLPLVFDRLVWDQKRRGVKIGLAEIGAFILPLGTWFSFAFIYFGALFPHSIAAKAAAYNLPWHSALVRFMQHYATPFMGHTLFGTDYIKLGIVLFPALSLVASLRLFKQDKSNWPFLLFPWGYAAAFALANPLVFRWYLTPPLPFYFLFVLAGAEFFLREILKAVKALHCQSLVFGLVVVILPLVPLLYNWRLHPDHGLDRPAPEMAWYKLELLYTDVARELAPQIQGRDVVLAAGDVGALGYYTDAVILDTVGLMSPEAARYYPLLQELYSEYTYAIPPDLILDYQPDYLVTLEIYIRSGLEYDPRFLEQYELIKTIPTDIYGSDGMLVYQKK